MVSFTGGVAVGKSIAERLGYRRAVLELGGHDPMLVLNMTLFNFTDGWNRAFFREQYARFSV